MSLDKTTSKYKGPNSDISESSKFRNNERRNVDAKQSFKREITKENDALAIS